MNNFFDYFNEDIGLVFQAFVDAIGACFNFLNYLFNFPMRMDIIKEHAPGFSTGDWVMLLIVNIALIAACCAIIYLVVKTIRKIFFGGISKKEYEPVPRRTYWCSSDVQGYLRPDLNHRPEYQSR